MKKKGVMSLWKAILLVIFGLIGAAGVTALVLFLTGQFNEKVVEPADMSVVQSVNGQGLYNGELNRFELSGDSYLTISSTTEGVTKTKVSLSFENLPKPIVKDGKISDGNIIIPQTVYLNKPFQVSVCEKYNPTIGCDWAVGGISKIIAASESSEKLDNQRFTVCVDVPVYGIDLNIQDAEQAETVKQVVVGSVFSLKADFAPASSAFMFNDSSRTKKVFYSLKGESLSYDEEENKFTAIRENSGNEYSTVTAYAFKNSFYQQQYFDAPENQNVSTNDVVAYLKEEIEKGSEKAISSSINIHVGGVSVDNVEFALTGNSLSTYVDKKYVVTAKNASAGDKTLGISISDSNGNELNGLFSRVGIKIVNGLNGLSILGGRIVKVSGENISIEDFDKSYDYANDNSATYYVLPDTSPASALNYNWTISATEVLEADLYVNFFYADGNVWKKYFDVESSFKVVALNHNDQAVGWKTGCEGTIQLSITYDKDNNSVSNSVNLAQEINTIESSNVYKLVKYFLFVDGASVNAANINIDEVFNVESPVEYTEFFNGDPIAIEGISGTSFNLYELKNSSSSLQALKSFEGTIKVVAAIVRTNVDNIPYKDGNAYQIVNISRARDVSVESTLSISNMEATFRFEGGNEQYLDEADGNYYIPSVSLKDEGEGDGIDNEKTIVYIDLLLKSNDSAKDAEKVLNAFNDGNGSLDVVCLDANDEVNVNQYMNLTELTIDAEMSNDFQTVFVGKMEIDKSKINQTNGFYGVYVGLQLQFNDGKEMYTKEILSENLDDHFYIYYQVPAEFIAPFEQYDLDPQGPVSVVVSDTTTIKWKSLTGEDGECPVGIDELLSESAFTIKDQKGRDIKTSDGLYRVRFVEEESDGSEKTSDNLLSFNGSASQFLNFNTTQGQNLTTYLSAYVEDMEGNVYKNSERIEFNIKSDGLSKVMYDSSTLINEKELEESAITSEITVSKYVSTGDKITLSNLFEIYTSNGTEEVKDDSFEIKLDGTYLSKFGESAAKDLMLMMTFYEGVASADDKITNHTEAIEEINILAPFKEKTTLVFNIFDVIDGSTNRLYTVKLNVELLADINIVMNFDTAQEKYLDYLSESKTNPYAISVFAEQSFNLDEVLKFPSDLTDSTGNAKYSWVKGTEHRTGLFEEYNNIVTMQTTSGEARLKIGKVYKHTTVTFKLYYGIKSSFAFSVEVTLYIIPNIIIVQEQEGSNFIDISSEEVKTVPNIYKYYMLTEYVDWMIGDKTSKSEYSFAGIDLSYSNISEDSYLEINSRKEIVFNSSKAFEYEIGKVCTQKFVINCKKGEDASDVLDAVVLPYGQEMIKADSGNTTIDFTLGYYSSDPVAMIHSIVPDAKVVIYNGEYTLLLLVDSSYDLASGFTLTEVSEMGYINNSDSSKIATYSTMDDFVSFGESVVVRSDKVELTLPVIVTKIGELFVNYDDASTQDFAVLIGDYSLLENNNVYQELMAGDKYTVVSNSNILGYTKTSDTVIDFGKKYYVFDESYVEIGKIFYKDAEDYIEVTSLQEDVTTYYYKQDSENYVEIAMSNLYEYHYGFFYDLDKANISQDLAVNNLDVEIVTDADGYVDGLAVIDGHNLTILDTTLEDKYIVLKFTIKTINELYSYSWYYRIKVVPNAENGTVVYPYAKDAEYLDSTASNIATTYTYDSSSKKYTIDLDETFDGSTNSVGKNRFNTTENISALIRGSEYFVESVSINGSTVSNISEYASISSGILTIVTKNSSDAYVVVIGKRFVGKYGEILGSRLYYTFKVNQSSVYESRVTIDGETVTQENGVYEHTLTAGPVASSGTTASIKTELFISSNGTSSNVENYSYFVDGAENYAEVSYNETKKEITIKTKERIETNGSFKIVFFNNERVVFVINVYVNSSFKVEIVADQVDSGKVYKYNELFVVTGTEGDVTNNVTLTLSSGNENAYKFATNSDSDKTIEFAYLESDTIYVFDGTVNYSGEAPQGAESITSFKFKVEILVKAGSPLIKNSYSDRTTPRYGKKSFDVGIADVKTNYFGDLGIATLSFKDVDGLVLKEENTKLTITPENVSKDMYFVNQTLTFVYSFKKSDAATAYTREFTVTYSYTVYKNVSVEANYPNPDAEEENSNQAEYVKTGSSITLGAAAPFGEGNRVSYAIVKDSAKNDVITTEDITTVVEVASSENVEVTGILGYNEALTLSLLNTATEGRVTFKVTVNAVSVEYNVIVVNSDIIRATFNSPDYTDNKETIYAEDLAGYSSQNLFESNRILNYTFADSATENATYYIRMYDGDAKVYRIFEVVAKAKNESLNFDMGNSYTDMTYNATYSTFETAQLGGTDGRLSGLYVVEPNVTSRVAFYYYSGEQVEGITASYKVGDNNFVGLTTSNYQQNVTVAISVTQTSTAIELYRTQYNLYLDTEFVVYGNADTFDENGTGYVVAEVGASSTHLSLFEKFQQFGITNKRLGALYTAEIMEKSNANFDLQIYGFSDLQITESDTPEVWKFHNKFGLTPRANGYVLNSDGSINNDGSETDNTYNYITISADTSSGKNTDYRIRARGACNDGNYVMMKINYVVTWGTDKQITTTNNLLFKVLPNSEILFNDGTVLGGTEQLEGKTVTTNKNSPIVIQNSSDSTNTTKLYDASNDLVGNVIAHLYGNRTINNASTFKYNITRTDTTIGDKTYNNTNAAFEVSGDTVSLPTLTLGTRYFYIDAENLFGYKIRIYYTLNGDVRPTVALDSLVLTENQSLAFALSYTNVDVSTASITGSDGGTKDGEYQLFSNNAKVYSGDVAVKTDVVYFATVNDVYDETGNVYNGRIYTSLNNDTKKMDTTWRTLGSKIVYKDKQRTNKWSLTEGTTAIEIGEKNAESNSIGEIYLKIDKTTGRVPESGVTYYKNESSVYVEETLTTFPSDHDVYTLYRASYTKSSSESKLPTDTVPNYVGQTATFAGIDAFAFNNNLSIIDKSRLSDIKSRVGDFKITQVAFYKDGNQIGKVGGEGSSAWYMFTNGDKIFAKFAETASVVAGTDFNETDNSITIPYMNGFYYGTGDIITGVVVKFTISETSGTNTAEITQTVTIKKADTSELFTSYKIADGNSPVKSSEGTAPKILNDTLEVKLQPGKSVSFTLKGTDGKNAGEKVSLINNKTYATTEYVGITSNLSGLTQNLEVGKVIKVEVDGDASGVSFAYNGSGLTGNTLTIAEYSSVSLHINSKAELPSTLTSNSCVTRKMYFIYSGNGQTYQTVKTFNVYPEYYGTTSSKHDASGNIEFSVTGFQKNGNNYVIPRSEWGKDITMLSATVSSAGTLAAANGHKFTFEINAAESGGAGAAFIDDNGTIVTSSDFNITSGTITVNLYIKVSGNDGYYKAESDIMIGQFTISLRGNSTTPDSSTAFAKKSASTTEEYTDHIVEINKEISIKDIFETDSPTNGSAHYHVVEDNFNGRCSELYERYISGYNGTRVNVSYDDCNPFGMIAGDFGEITSLSKHTSQSASESTIVAFNSLSELFATFMGNFEIPTNDTEYIPTVSGNALNSYTQFYNKAIELYNSSLVSFTKNVSNDLTRSAVIGVNHLYTMAFGGDISPELIDFQTVIANLFGFSSKTEFMNYAQDLADTYAQHRTNITNSLTTNEALENGCFYTSNGSFVFPIAVKNELASTVLVYVILDTSGLVSVWVNDITAALWATNFNSSYHTDSIINNELYCKNILFVTGTTTPYIKDNMDKWTFTTAGEHTLTIVKSVNAGVSYSTHTAKFFVFDPSISSEKNVYLEGREYTLGEGYYKLGNNSTLTPVANLGNSDLTNGKTEILLFEVKGSVITPILYTFYYVSGSENKLVGKTVSENWNLANLDENAIAFYKINKEADGTISKIIQTQAEDGVTGNASCTYLAKYADGTFKKFEVQYYIVANTETQKYKLITSVTNYKVEIGNDVAIGEGEKIYTIDNKGFLTELAADRKIPSDKNTESLKTVIVKGTGTPVYRYVYNFTTYELEANITKETSAYLPVSLSSLDDDVKGAINALVGADTVSGTVTYYLYDATTGRTNEIVSQSIDSLVENIQKQYYVKVGNRYFLINVTFTKNN